MAIFGWTIDTRSLFPEERAALLELLGSLGTSDWSRPTVCPGWNVRDIVGHLVNDYLRRLSGSRDGHAGVPFSAGETLPDYLRRINEEFVRAVRQCGPHVLIDLVSHLGPQLDQLWVEADLDAPAWLNVSWADPVIASPTWLDIAREFTEFWMHQQQIRDAVGRPGATTPRLLAPVLDTLVRALPQALRGQIRPRGTTLRFEVTGPAGGTWLAVRQSDRWRLSRDDRSGVAEASVSMDQDTLWRLASRGISVAEARRRSRLAGDPGLHQAATTLLAIVR